MRYLTEQIKKDLQKKMVFIGGPRQVGKTTLSKFFLKKNDVYFNWDISADRTKLLAQEFPVSKL